MFVAGAELSEVIDPSEIADDLLSRIERGELQIIELIHPDETALPSSLGLGPNAKFEGLVYQSHTASEVVLIGDGDEVLVSTVDTESDTGELDPQSAMQEFGVVRGGWGFSALNSRRRPNIPRGRRR